MTDRDQLIQACERLIHEAELYAGPDDQNLLDAGKDILDVATALKERLEAEPSPMEKFGRAVLDEFYEHISDIDGEWIQDKALELGALVPVEVTEPCGEMCNCTEYGQEFPTTCYRIAETKP